jgi:protein involved in polysaccharide export with SLBB domain
MRGIIPTICTILMGLFLPIAAFAEAYLLGPEDVVSLRVVNWDDATATYVSMEGVTGEYKVSAGGAIALPIVGSIAAQGRTIEEVSEGIAERLKASVGLYQLPIVSLQIGTYRPFYISGDVNNPGSYAWRPQLTASKAVALAGGLFRNRSDGIDDTSGFREISSLQSVQVELVRLLARAARLEAELSKSSDIEFPERLTHPDGPDAVDSIKTEERSILAIRLETFLRATESNEALIALHQTELEGLQGKLDGQQRQLQITTEQVETLRALIERGTVPANRIIAVEQTLTDLNAEELDLNTAIFRSRQRIGETKRDLQQMTNDRRHDAVTQLQETRRRIELETKREEMLVGLVAATGVRPIDMPIVTRLRVRRDNEGEVSVLSIDPDDPIKPGDVFEVELSIELSGQ